jgi:hypothetical protein
MTTTDRDETRSRDGLASQAAITAEIERVREEEPRPDQRPPVALTVRIRRSVTGHRWALLTRARTHRGIDRMSARR